MLILTRRLNEEIVISGGVRIKVVDIKGDKIRLGIEAPKTVAVHRSEVAERIGFEGRKPAGEQPILEPVDYTMPTKGLVA